MTALLDAQAGVQYEGETADATSDVHASVALQAWNHLANGMGAIDWCGVDTVVAALGVPDEQLELLLHRLAVIKRHRPPEGARG